MWWNMRKLVVGRNGLAILARYSLTDKTFLDTGPAVRCRPELARQMEATLKSAEGRHRRGNLRACNVVAVMERELCRAGVGQTSERSVSRRERKKWRRSRRKDRSHRSAEQLQESAQPSRASEMRKTSGHRQLVMRSLCCRGETKSAECGPAQTLPFRCLSASPTRSSLPDILCALVSAQFYTANTALASRDRARLADDYEERSATVISPRSASPVPPYCILHWPHLSQSCSSRANSHPIE